MARSGRFRPPGRLVRSGYAHRPGRHRLRRIRGATEVRPHDGPAGTIDARTPQQADPRGMGARSGGNDPRSVPGVRLDPRPRRRLTRRRLPQREADHRLAAATRHRSRTDDPGVVPLVPVVHRLLEPLLRQHPLRRARCHAGSALPLRSRPLRALAQYVPVDPRGGAGRVLVLSADAATAVAVELRLRRHAAHVLHDRQTGAPFPGDRRPLLRHAQPAHRVGDVGGLRAVAAGAPVLGPGAAGVVSRAHDLRHRRHREPLLPRRGRRLGRAGRGVHARQLARLVAVAT